jgi:dTDP-glucose 4,6-dehydratase
MKKLVVTGGLGFIGSNFIKKSLLKNNKILNIDKITYAGNLDNLSILKKNKNYNFLNADISNKNISEKILKFHPDAIIHFAAESHVDRSIENPQDFLQTNIIGTYNLLETVRNNKNIKFVHISTDEVYGDLGKTKKKFNKKSKFNPSSPYSASKASADHLVSAWHKTYGINSVIINCSNNYGPNQYPEKLIPHAIICLINNKKIPIYGKGNQVRDWLFVEDHCDAIDKVLNNGKPGETYLVGGNNEIKNINLVKMIVKIFHQIQKTNFKVNFIKHINFVRDRPGHDLRYSVDISFIEKKLNWKPKTDFKDGLYKTILWYLNNSDWIKNLEKKKFKLKRLG